MTRNRATKVGDGYAELSRERAGVSFSMKATGAEMLVRPAARRQGSAARCGTLAATRATVTATCVVPAVTCAMLAVTRATTAANCALSDARCARVAARCAVSDARGARAAAWCATPGARCGSLIDDRGAVAAVAAVENAHCVVLDATCTGIPADCAYRDATRASNDIDFAVPGAPSYLGEVHFGGPDAGSNRADGRRDRRGSQCDNVESSWPGPLLEATCRELVAGRLSRRGRLSGERSTHDINTNTYKEETVRRVGRSTLSSFQRVQEFLAQRPFSEGSAALGAQLSELNDVTAHLENESVSQESSSRFVGAHVE
jgi:hypothetical protein